MPRSIPMGSGLTKASQLFDQMSQKELEDYAREWQLAPVVYDTHEDENADET